VIGDDGVEAGDGSLLLDLVVLVVVDVGEDVDVKVLINKVLVIVFNTIFSITK
jgi:hypothetical protein